MSTRIIVKNIPKHMTEARLRTHFAGAGGTVTDAKIIRTKDGRSRLFAFVGFQTATEARKAVNHFNNTFIDTSRVSVEAAKGVGDESLGRPWSRYSKGSSLYMKAHPQEVAQYRKEEREKAAKKAAKAENGDGSDAEAEDKEQMERFLAAMHVSKDEIKKKKQERVVKPEIILPGTAKKDEEEPAGKKEKGKKKDEDAQYRAQGTGKKVMKETVKSKMFGSTGEALEKIHVKFEDSDEEDDDGIAEVEKQKARNEAGKIVGVSKRDAVANKPAKADKEGSGDAKSDEDDYVDDGKLDEATELAVVTAQIRAEQQQWEEGRLFVRNLSYQTKEIDLERKFSEFGPVAEVHVPIDKQTGKNKGFAFVLFVNATDAVKAFSALDGAVLQGRLLHIIPARAAPNDARKLAQKEGAGSEYKDAAAEKQRALAQNPFNWNALFVRQDTVAEAMSNRLDVRKSELLDRDSSNLAVRMALSEAHVLAETKKSLSDQGVNIEALEKGPMATRSNTSILVKNLPADTKAAELSALFEPFGTVLRVVMPPSCAVAIVELSNTNEAKAAFRGLAYRRFRHVPIFLEWAPEDVFNAPAKKKEDEEEESASEHEEEPAVKEEEPEKEKPTGEEEDVAEEQTAIDAVPRKTHTVYVKNINFDSTEESLKKAFEEVCGRYAAIRRVTIPRRTDPSRKDVTGKPMRLSLGFAFIEYSTENEAVQAVKLMDGKVVDGHQLQVSLSRPVVTAPEGSKAAEKHLARRAATADSASRIPKSSKLMVRNVPFEATKKELREVFAPFAQIKSIRLPKRADGRARGFAFVEFLTKQEAAAAMEAVKDVHFYGRHLVLEYSSMDQNGQDGEENAEEDTSMQDAKKDAKKRPASAADNAAAQKKRRK